MNALQTLPIVDVTLSSDGAPLAIAADLLEVEVAQRTYEPAACELRVRDATGAIGAQLQLGCSLEVKLGLEQRSVFRGQLAAVEYHLGPSHECELRLLAYDALATLRSRMAVRVHVDVSFAELARELTRDLGMIVESAGSTPVYRRIVQHRRSDLDVLADIAERSGLAFRLDGTTLRAYPLAGDRGTVTLHYGTTLREATVLSTSVDDVNDVDVRGWDVGRAEPRRGSAAGNAAGPTLPLTNVIVDSDAHADALARSQLARRTTAALRVEAVADGDPALCPGVRVALTGVPDPIAGPHAITGATHRFDPRAGYTTTIQTALPAPHAPDETASSTLGIVTDVRDPATLGRVKVRYPAVADAESDWLQVLAAGAGGGKGLVALPTLGDTVLVMVLDGDLAHGIVLGALYGAGGMPGRRGRPFAGYAFYSPGGHVVELADGGALTLHAAGGSYLELGPKGTTLHSETDLIIDAPGKNVAIRAQTVDITKA